MHNSVIKAALLKLPADGGLHTIESPNSDSDSLYRELEEMGFVYTTHREEDEAIIAVGLTSFGMTAVSKMKL